MGFSEILKKDKEPKHWTDEKWAKERRLVIRPDVPGAHYYPPDFSHLFDTEEKRENFSRAVSMVIEDTLSDEGPQWARGLPRDHVLSLEALLEEFEQEQSQGFQPNNDGFEMRFDDGRDRSEKN